ncbi:hypothetical protein BGZ76_004217 [Entomortierella beljakovae]|nr:hypothetical protein BGZ76_004217 [Entomortierella beljakovae]
MSANSKSSGLVTPPLASPLPIQTSMTPPHTNTNSWKAVGSPPRNPLLSPPDEIKKPITESSANKDIYRPQYSEQIGIGYLSSSPTGSTGLSSLENPDSNSAISAQLDMFSITAPSHSSANLQDGSVQTPVTHSPQALSNYIPSSSRLNGFLTEKTQGYNSLGQRRNQDLSYGPLDNNGHQSQQQRQPDFQDSNINSRINESPLGLSSFIWDNRVANELGSNPSSSMATALGGMPALIRHDSSPEARYVSMSEALRAEPFVPNNNRPTRSLSLSEPLGFHTGFNNGKSVPNSRGDYGQSDGDLLGSFRSPLPIMEEEPEDMFEHPRAPRTRSFSTSATFGPGTFFGSASGSTYTTDLHDQSPSGGSSQGQLGRLNQDQHPFLNRKFSVGSTWPSISHNNPVSDNGRPIMNTTHRRSVTSNTFVSPIWESSNPNPYVSSAEPFLERVERQRIRRYSLAPSSGFQSYDQYLESEQMNVTPSSIGYGAKIPADSDYIHPHRRHSVAGPTGSYFKQSGSPYDLSSSLDSLQLEDSGPTHSWGLSDDSSLDEYHHGSHSGSNDTGKGMTLSQLSHHGSLYVVEFKAGRSDLFYVADNNNLVLKRGDLVMVEADRGKDLGKITNDSITPQQIQALQKEHSEAAALAQQEGQRTQKEIQPKRVLRVALPAEISQLANKNQDEIKAMLVCQTKVRQKKLPMEVVDAEYQWDRRKLTFYFRAEHRIDFRELVRDLFKIYKTRIWMYAVSPSMASALAQEANVAANQPRSLPSPVASPISPRVQQSANQYPLQQPISQQAINLFHQYQHQQQQLQQQFAQQQHLQGNNYQQPQIQEMMRQMQGQFYSPPQQPVYHTIQQDYPQHVVDEEQHQTPFYEQPYQLQPPHPLM